MKRTSTLLVVVAVAVLGVVAAVAHGTPTSYTAMMNADMTIHHAMVGCHTWSLNGRTALQQHVVIRVGRSFTLQNLDNCPHKLVQTSGASQDVVMTSATDGTARDGNLASFQAPLRVNLFATGTYTFTTDEGVADLDRPQTGFYRMQSVGPDHQLQLTVTVLPLAKADE